MYSGTEKAFPRDSEKPKTDTNERFMLNILDIGMHVFWHCNSGAIVIWSNLF